MRTETSSIEVGSSARITAVPRPGRGRWRPVAVVRPRARAGRSRASSPADRRWSGAPPAVGAAPGCGRDPHSALEEVLDAVYRVQRAERVLEDHLDLAPVRARGAPAFGAEHVCAVEQDASRRWAAAAVRRNGRSCSCRCRTRRPGPRSRRGRCRGRPTRSARTTCRERSPPARKSMESPRSADHRGRVAGERSCATVGDHGVHACPPARLGDARPEPARPSGRDAPRGGRGMLVKRTPSPSPSSGTRGPPAGTR